MNDPTAAITYRIIPANGDYKVEVNRPGEMVRTAEGFRSEADARSWIAEDRRIADIDARQKPIEPPHLRKADP
jgi:hypothetical protein